MPLFSILRRSAKDRKQSVPGSDSTTHSDGSTSPDFNQETGAGSERERRGSARELIQDLINRSIRGASRSGSVSAASSSGNSNSTPSVGFAAALGAAGTPRRGRGKPCDVEPAKTGLASPPLSPRSPINANKPLPSPPPAGSEEPVKPKPVLKLARIMSTLSDSELEKLFSGAPQFFARSEGVNTGAPNPSVAFPWDETLEIRDLTDHTQIEDEAWGCVTALPHLVRSPRRRSSVSSIGKIKRAHFYPKCRERPNMLSMQGLEKGTVGFSAALELSAADALQEEQYGFESAGGRRPDPIIEARQKMLTSKDGLRYLEEPAIMEQLIKNGRRYVTNDLRDNMLSTDLYNELFLHILHPPTRVLDHQDPYSLSVQIQALLKVLNTPNVWVDFSHVEWRIRLGQVLWGSPSMADVEDVLDGEELDAGDSIEARSEERYWLLLQILLACELWIRLDAIVEADDAGTEHIKPREIYRFQQEAKTAVKWSMLLAKSWLENIEVLKVEGLKPDEAATRHSSAGWLATFTKRLSLASDNGDKSLASLAPGSRPSSRATADHPAYDMRGKHGQRQVDGLTHFARRLKWPGIDAYEARISNNVRAVSEKTPLNTPLASPASDMPSYFGSAAVVGSGNSAKTSMHIADQVRRQPSKRRKIAAALHPAGWLSKSYVSGLMLPGEGLSHFLMSTLLENDTEAMAKLGPMANLCGGFVYSGKSFWSTSCIVGRVIAAGKGSVECMGWISSDITPYGLSDGWVNVEVADIPGESSRLGRQARIWGKAAIERQSSVLGDGDLGSVLPADFIIPFENLYKGLPPPALWIELKALNLFARPDSESTTPAAELSTPLTQLTETTASSSKTSPDIQTYPAAVKFTVGRIDDYNDYGDGLGDDGVEKEYTFNLTHDVYFATAHPCVPSQHVKVLKSPSSPTIQQIDLESSTDSINNENFSNKRSSPVNITGHPLHKYYTYTAIHLSELLDRRDSTLDDLLNNPGPNEAYRRPSIAPGPHGNKTARVLVVDCITGFQPLPQAHEIPLSPVVSRSSSLNMATWEASPPRTQVLVLQEPSPPRSAFAAAFAAASSTSSNDTMRLKTTPPINTNNTDVDVNGVAVGGAVPESPGHKMHSETRRRQFGSDMEILIRALCAEKGWNALVSRRRRGCLACAIREAGALGWKVIIRVD
ncbi:hypothetical protein MCOR30_002378 [Pyricularia oryzae]|nr:hypothetical protein MCOR30_002378 [Pyricularia oryzae]